jgi:hypothetical protein
VKPIDMLKFHGNINRIKELDDAGYGADTISRTFQSHNIDISEQDVRSLLKVRNTLTKKALPKAEVKKLIKQDSLIDFRRELSSMAVKYL